MTTLNTLETGCCSRFQPEKWQNSEVTFKDKLFLKDHVTSFFHIPLNYSQVMERDAEMIANSGAKAENLILNDENSLFGADVYIAVDKEVNEAEMERLSGHFLTKVYEGPYKDMYKFEKDMKKYLLSKGIEHEKFLFYYTYCPKCAEVYGKNYIVIFAKVAEMAA